MIALLRETLGSSLGLGEEQIALLDQHWQLLSLANRRFNLTAIIEETAAAEKHYLDSLLALPRIRSLTAGQPARLADIGSGGGFPGLLLAVCLPELSVTLLEATGKKCVFLQDCLQQLRLSNASVLKLRAEEAGQTAGLRAAFDLVTARAVAPLNVLLEYALPLLKPGGRLLAYKGADYQRELGEAGRALRILGGAVAEIHPFRLPGGAERRHIVEVEKQRQTPPQYPRRPGLPAQKPL